MVMESDETIEKNTLNHRKIHVWATGAQRRKIMHRATGVS
jgi:hypothetical protein